MPRHPRSPFPLFPDDHVLGRADVAADIVSCTDYTCPYTPARIRTWTWREGGGQIRYAFPAGRSTSIRTEPRPHTPPERRRSSGRCAARSWPRSPVDPLEVAEALTSSTFCTPAAHRRRVAQEEMVHRARSGVSATDHVRQRPQAHGRLPETPPAPGATSTPARCARARPGVVGDSTRRRLGRGDGRWLELGRGDCPSGRLVAEGARRPTSTSPGARPPSPRTCGGDRSRRDAARALDVVAGEVRRPARRSAWT